MVVNKAIKTFQEFIKLESASGIILFVMAILALIIANSPLQHFYFSLINLHLSFELGQFTLTKILLHWVNDGLMAIFFLLVGLEIKREVVEGELNSLTKLALPCFAAIGGMLVPAIIYVCFNWNHGVHLTGWAIPTATDIAFALGLLSLLGRRIPISLKIFLTAIAILDDIGAIIIIAIYYTHDLSVLSLILAGICIVILLVLNLSGVRNKASYVLVGFLLWLFVLQSGVHATLAGIILAMVIPIRDKKNPQRSPLREMEHTLHPWVAFAVLPIFAFFNAGVSFSGISLTALTSPVPLGIAFGLFFGKQIGVFGATWLAVKSGVAKLPRNLNWKWIYGVALLCGIGFTMSLFIGSLAFGNVEGSYTALVTVGILVGSLLSGVVGYFFLLYCARTQIIITHKSS